MKTARFPDPIQIRARMTKEATGMDFISRITGSASSRNKKKRYAMAPAAMPQKKAARNPRLILPKDRPMEIQKPGEGMRDKKDFPTSRGLTKRMGLSIARAATCHIAAQNRRIPVFRRIGFDMIYILSRLKQGLRLQPLTYCSEK